VVLSAVWTPGVAHTCLCPCESPVFLPAVDCRACVHALCYREIWILDIMSRGGGGLPGRKRKGGIELGVFEGLSSLKMFVGLAVTGHPPCPLSAPFISTHEADFKQVI